LEGEADEQGGGSDGDGVEGVDIEGAADFIAGEVFESGVNGDLELGGGPGVIGEEVEGGFAGTEGGTAGHIDGDKTEGEGGVERFPEVDDEWIVGAGFGKGELPVGRNDGGTVLGDDGEGLAEGAKERGAVGVAPVGIDLEGVGLSGFEGGADFVAREDAALDASGVKEDGEAFGVAVPEFLIDFEEGEFHDRTVGAPKAEVVPGLAGEHGSGELDVELELIGGNIVGRGEDVLDEGGGREGLGFGGKVEDFAGYDHAAGDGFGEVEAGAEKKVCAVAGDRAEDGREVAGADVEGDVGSGIGAGDAKDGPFAPDGGIRRPCAKGRQ
jgi:hypothetical protein